MLGRGKKNTPDEKTEEKKADVAPVKSNKKELAKTTVNFEEDSGVGQEDMTEQDYAIPRLGIVQKTSGYVDEQEPIYIEGAKAGMIVDGVSSELWDSEEGVLVVPVKYRRTHVEWKPDGGGFVRDHGDDPSVLDGTTKDSKGNHVTAEGNHIQVTAEYFVFLVDPESGTFAAYVLSMSSSQLKKARRWNTMINQFRIPRSDGQGTFNPAMFFSAFRFTTVPESNDKGNWFGWKIVREANVVDLPNGEDIYMAAKSFREDVDSGKVKVHDPRENEGSGAASESDSDPM